MSKKNGLSQIITKHRQTLILWITNFGACLIISLLAKNKFSIFVFAILFLFVVFTLIRSFYDKVIISESKIIAVRYFKTQEINWTDISTLKPGMAGFLLTNYSGDVKVFISAELMNLWKFVKTVKKYRPDLLQPTKTTFRENPMLAWVIGVAGLFFIYYSARQIIASFDDLFLKIFIALFGLGFVLLAVFLLKSFTFDNDKLIVRTLARERAIYLTGLDFSSASNKSILIISNDGYSISVENLVEGIPSFLITFQAWLQSGSGDFYENIQGIS
jgi:hypothetical protein